MPSSAACGREELVHFAVVYFVDKRRAEATIGTVARTLVRTVELYPQGAQGKAWETINSDNALFLGDLGGF